MLLAVLAIISMACLSESAGEVTDKYVVWQNGNPVHRLCVKHTDRAAREECGDVPKKVYDACDIGEAWPKCKKPPQRQQSFGV